MPSQVDLKAQSNRRSEAKDPRFGCKVESPSTDHRSRTAASRAGRETGSGHRERPGRACVSLAGGSTTERRDRAIYRIVNRARRGENTAAEPRGQAVQRTRET